MRPLLQKRQMYFTPIHVNRHQIVAATNQFRGFAFNAADTITNAARKQISFGI
jgi:hypothetical protein